MTGEQLRELINRDLDGELSPSEQGRLAQILRRDSAARALHAEMAALAASLRSVPRVDPPANLATRIKADVHSRVAAPARRRSVVDALRNLIQTPALLRYGTVFAGGAVCGALVFMLAAHPLSSPNVSGQSASGSLIVQSQTFPVDLGQVHGMLTAVPTETGEELTFRLNCGAEATTRVTYDPSRVKLENVREVQTAGGPVVVNEGVVALTGTGTQRCTMTFSGVKDSRVSVEVASKAGGAFRTEVQVH